MIITVTGHSNENKSIDEEDDDQEEKQVCNLEAGECFKNCLSWTQRQSNVDPPMFYFFRNDE